MALIVAAEDDADVADLLTATLGREGHTVRVVPCGQRVLDLIAERRPDLVILDHKMPGLTGLDVARRLRADEHTASLPILMVSACAPDTAPDFFDRVLQLPVSLFAIAEAAKDLLARAGGHCPAAAPRAVIDPLRLSAVASLLDEPDPVDQLELTMAAANVAAMADAPTAMISLVLNDATVTLAGIGVPDLIGDGAPLEWTPDRAVADGGRAIMVADLAGDPVYRGTPLASLCGLRSYAGVPLRTACGLVVGTLSVLDRDPAGFSARVLRRMTTVTPEIMRLIDRRRA